MTQNASIRIKAVFLLAVFSLNTLVGFACATGLNMGFNAKHHHDEETVSPAIGHHHKGATHHHEGKTSTVQKAREDNNCCNDVVIKFSQVDKLLTHAINAGIELPVMLASLHFLYLSHLSSFTQGHGRSLPVPRPYVVDSRGIRVSIQSFQI